MYVSLQNPGKLSTKKQNQIAKTAELEFARPGSGRHVISHASVKHRPQAPAPRSNGTKVFLILILTGWVCVGALIKWDARWLYLLLGLTVIAGLWAGRPRALPRVLLLLALVFPVWKKLEQRPHPVAAGVNAAATGEKAAPVTDDAAVISALVTAEETYLTL